MKTCSDRKVVEMEKYSWSMQQPRQHGHLKLPVRAELPPSEEDWESEATVTRSYDPRAKAEKMQVLRKIEGATPSERKVFRALEKHRHEVLNEEKEKGGPASKTKDDFSRESISSRATNPFFKQRIEKETGGALRKPTLTPSRQEQEDEEPRGVRDSLLAAHLGRGRGLPASKHQQLRRPGSFLQPPSLDTTGLDSTMDSGRNTLDTRDTRNMSMDTLDMAINAVGKLSLGRGRPNPASGCNQSEQDRTLTLRKPTLVQSRPGPAL